MCAETPREDKAKEKYEVPPGVKAGIDLYLAGDFGAALEQFLQYPDDMTSQYHLACMCYRGEGAGRSPEKAAEFFEQAAGQGLAEAQFRLTMTYLSDSEDKNCRKAEKLGSYSAKKMLEVLGPE